MRRPATTARKGYALENPLHIAAAAFIEIAWPVELPWTHFPAGEYRGDKITRTRRDGSSYEFSPTGAKLKRMGLKPGWPDFQFVLPNAQFAVAEAKRETGDLSDPQRDLRRKLLALKVAYGTFRTLEELEELLRRWLDAMNSAGFRRPDGSLWALRASLRQRRAA